MGQSSSRRVNEPNNSSGALPSHSSRPNASRRLDSVLSSPVAAQPVASTARAHPGGVVWPSSGPDGSNGADSEPTETIQRRNLRSLTSKPNARRRLSRLIPARFLSTPTKPPPSTSIPLVADAISSPSSSSAASPSVSNVGSTSTRPAVPSLEPPSSPSNLAAASCAPDVQPSILVAESHPDPNTLAPPLEQPLNPPEPVVQPLISAESTQPTSTAQEDNVAPSGSVRNANLHERGSDASDSLHAERQAAARLIAETLGESGARDTTDAASSSPPQPQAVNRIIERLRQLEDRGPNAAISPPSPPATIPASLPRANPYQESSIASGTAMIVQGVVQTGDLTPRRNSSRSRRRDAQDARPPLESSNSQSSSRAHGRRGLFRLSRSASTPSINSDARRSTDTAEPQTPTFLPPGSASRPDTNQDADDDSALDTSDGLDVLTTLLSVVTAATGASLMNGSSAPDLSVVSDLVNRTSTPPTPSSPIMPQPAAHIPSLAPIITEPNPTRIPVYHPPSPSNESTDVVPPTPISPSSRVSRGRGLLDSVRSRLMRQRTLSLPTPRQSRSPSREPAQPQPQAAEDNRPATPTLPASSSSSDASRPNAERRQSAGMESLAAHLTQQLTEALRNNGLGMSARPISSAQAPPQPQGPLRRANLRPLRTVPVDPAMIPLPVDSPGELLLDASQPEQGPSQSQSRVDSAPTATESRPATTSATGILPQNVVGLSGDTSMSFQEFIVDIQQDLRGFLTRRLEVERARREREQGDSDPSTARNATEPPTSTTDPVSPVVEGEEDDARIRNRHLEHHVPSVDIPVNWWRMFRFPPRETRISPLVDLSASRPPSGTDDPSDPTTRALTPVLIVGLRQQRAPSTADLQAMAEVDDFLQNESAFPSAGVGSGAGTFPRRRERERRRSRVYPSFDSPTRESPSRRSTEPRTAPISPPLPTGSAGPSTPRPATTTRDSEASTRGESWRDQIRDYFSPPAPSSTAAPTNDNEPSSPVRDRGSRERERDRERERRTLIERLVHARREVRRAREALVRERARDNYVIWVIGGYYPEETVSTLVPHFLLGQFDHDDFWALAELLGQVKSPVATKEDIEDSGLKVIKFEELPKLVAAGSVAENTTEKCLICLSEYEAEEDLRLLSCRHAFHKDCVDTWMETGRNNCPACRAPGVQTHNESAPPV